MDIFVSAGETSSDIHSANILKIFSEKSGAEIRCFGLGGDALRAMGADLILHNREFSVMGGPTEILSKLPKRKKLEKTLEKILLNRKVDFALLVDNGEINLRLAPLLKFFKIPVVYYIPPKVWVWRHARIEKIKQHVDLVLSILPFEEAIYNEWEIPFAYVGNPVLDEVDANLNKETACKTLELDPKKKYISVFFGSRHSEVKHHVHLFSKALELFKAKLGESEVLPDVLIPVAPAIEIESLESDLKMALSKEFNIHLFKNKTAHENVSHLCLAASHAGIIKSGTSTLEAAVLGVPMVLAYKGSKLSHFLYKSIVRYRGFVGLVNLFLIEPAEKALGWDPPLPQAIVPELILDESSPERIAQEFHRIYIEGPERSKMLKELSRAKGLLKPRTGASSLDGAADELIKFCKNRGMLRSEGKNELHTL